MTPRQTKASVQRLRVVESSFLISSVFSLLFCSCSIVLWNSIPSILPGTIPTTTSRWYVRCQPYIIVVLGVGGQEEGRRIHRLVQQDPMDTNTYAFMCALLSDRRRVSVTLGARVCVT